MPLTYEIATSKNFVISKADNTLTASEMLASRTALARDIADRGPIDELLDLRNVREFCITCDQMYSLIAAEKKLGMHSRSGKMAIVAPSDFLYGMSRMYQILSEDSATEIQVFRRLREAKAWLKRQAARSRAKL